MSIIRFKILNIHFLFTYTFVSIFFYLFHSLYLSRSLLLPFPLCCAVLAGTLWLCFGWAVWYLGLSIFTASIITTLDTPCCAAYVPLQEGMATAKKKERLTLRLLLLHMHACHSPHTSHLAPHPVVAPYPVSPLTSGKPERGRERKIVWQLSWDALHVHLTA